jgi:sec-independent protein translocase protein TatB
MFGIGMPEMILILAIALIVIGPKKLPDLAKSLGRAMNEFKKATREIKDSIDIDGDLKDVKQSLDDLNQDVKEAVNINPLKSAQAQPLVEEKAPDTTAPPATPPSEAPTAEPPEEPLRNE